MGNCLSGSPPINCALQLHVHALLLLFTANKFVFFFFYRATLCVSTVFAVARCPPVCPSVRLSVTLVYCIQTAQDIVKLLSRTGSHIILLFDCKRRYLTPRVPLAVWVLNTRGGEFFFAIFD